MDFHKVELFIEVMRLGSFVAVSESRDLDPSIVSRAIASLEEELKTKLFYRTTRKLSPTEAGVAFFNSVVPLMEEFERVRNALLEKRDKPIGTIRVTTPVSFGLFFMVPLLAKFQSKYPSVHVDFLITDSVLNLVDERIDVAIRFGHLIDSSFVAAKLSDLDYVACASPAYLKKHGYPQKPKEILGHNCLSFLIPGFSDGWRFRSKKTGKEECVPIKGGLRISNAIALKESALLGVGIALLPKVLVGKEIESQRLIALFEMFDITATEFDSKIWVLYPSKDFLPSKTRVFVEFLKQEFAKIKFY